MVKMTPGEAIGFKKGPKGAKSEKSQKIDILTVIFGKIYPVPIRTGRKQTGSNDDASAIIIFGCEPDVGAGYLTRGQELKDK